MYRDNKKIKLINMGENPKLINEKLLSKYGIVNEYFIEHSTYNRMKGIAKYKKSKDNECLKVVQKDKSDICENLLVQ